SLRTAHRAPPPQAARPPAEPLGVAVRLRRTGTDSDRRTSRRDDADAAPLEQIAIQNRVPPPVPEVILRAGLPASTPGCWRLLLAFSPGSVPAPRSRCVAS